MALSTLRDFVFDWTATVASTGGVLASLVAFDVIQRVAIRRGNEAHQRAVSAMAAMTNRAYALTGGRTRATGTHHAQPGKPYIIVSNHQSMFDIVCAFVHIPVNVRFIAKKILKYIPFLGWYMSVTGMIFIDRRNREQALASLEAACERIRSGIPILVYPEGTRSKDGAILPFKKGPFMFALQAGVPIVPVAINGSINILLPGSPFVRPERVDIVMGQPIPTDGLVLEDRDMLMRTVRDAIIDLHVSIGGKGGDKNSYLAAEGKEGVTE
jgi:1-acyl-sn-glycerol-3-phosphate acyltransferase